jgi:hypothetical protein
MGVSNYLAHEYQPTMIQGGRALEKRYWFNCKPKQRWKFKLMDIGSSVFKKT